MHFFFFSVFSAQPQCQSLGNSCQFRVWNLEFLCSKGCVLTKDNCLVDSLLWTLYLLRLMASLDKYHCSSFLSSRFPAFKHTCIVVKLAVFELTIVLLGSIEFTLGQTCGSSQSLILVHNRDMKGYIIKIIVFS